ncbi:hypothetical protein D8674_024276 [Pyrus ussuriensis x Pyrus communis]|uniref:Uncharacterized protein n=1 Tax=Pyrus ussuriensis x Pyrus communis TaxID=2448454 RepID=A0A5N5FPT3_9ROSA|nr:hypothetical protein D8674_004267 [Pyrus ussuriensis x Pyrus communis]KAB2622094.1 hypothetical protein D8674_024276 [Pyrus ussuriensis x Pyrus communis]
MAQGRRALFQKGKMSRRVGSSTDSTIFGSCTKRRRKRKKSQEEEVENRGITI